MEIGQYQPNLDGDGLRIGIVQSRFNEPVCNGLADACIEELERLGVTGEDVLLVTVPGALEIPLALQKLAESGQFDALIQRKNVPNTRETNSVPSATSVKISAHHGGELATSVWGGTLTPRPTGIGP